ncbi:MAG: helix-turn-helix transcriptional regulator [Kibdelosporangium sp.]
MSGRRAEPNYHGRQLLRELRKLRFQAGLSQQEAGERAHIDHSKLSRIEQQQVPTYHELVILLDVYGVLSCDLTPYFDLWELAKRRGWWREYTSADHSYLCMEDEADVKKEFQLGHLPTLLQTEKYARTALTTNSRSTKTTDKLVALRMRQQQRLHAERTLSLHALVHEAVLRQSSVDRAQLTLLLQRAELSTVTIQIVPERLLHEALQGSVILLSFDDPAEPDIAFADTPLGLAQTHDPRRTATITRTLDRLTSLAMSPADSCALLAAHRQAKSRGAGCAGRGRLAVEEETADGIGGAR